MILCIADVLSVEELANLSNLLTQADFVDGKLTAGWHARQVKHNQQIRTNTEQYQSLSGWVQTALKRSELFQMAARPTIVRSPLFSRYDVGMSYGTHVDNAVMTHNGQPMRTDLSLTIFLNSPEDYQGESW